MKWKHLVLPSAVVCVAALSLGISITVRRLHAGGGAQVSPKAVHWVPYQIGYKTYNKKSDWLQPLLLAESMRAVRSDGASVESYIDYKLNRSILHQRGALNLPGGVHILTSERLGLMTATRDVTKDGDERARQRLDPSQSCAISMEGGQVTQSSVVAREMLLGYETYKVVVDMKVYRDTSWYAPALGCAELRMLGEKINVQSGQVEQTTDRTAIEIRTGEPDPALFELPKGLRNVSPSELAAASRQVCCQASLKDTEVAAFQPLDELFRKFRFDW